MLRWLCVAVALLSAVGCSKPPAAPAVAEYIDSRTCAACHAAIAKTYRDTAMAQAFSRVTPAAMSAKSMLGRYAHAASGRTYEVVERDGRYFQSRTIGSDTYRIEREIHYVMGSGRHARTFIHRTLQGRLVELPLGWYTEGGGALAMSPGYDRPAPLDFRRKISTDCMFCHNAYPAMRAGANDPAPEPVFPAEMPEGIDCQRCHGPGSLHVAAASGGQAKPEEIRRAIVNPSRLGPELAMEVCMQCHLETTSFPLPNSLVRFGRGAFSYRPGEPLSDFTLHFDHTKESNRGEKFEIVNAAYRLRQAKCFLASGGKLTCTTCHNPHDVPRGPAARVAYAKACSQCHAGISGGPHTNNADCAGCHMPRRRTEDVVHAVMTDHKIVRRAPPGDLLAPRKEQIGNDYAGEVALYYPSTAKDQEMYLAVAQIVQNANLRGGVPRMEAFIQSQRPAEPKVYFALAGAYEAQGKPALAEAQYREALRRNPTFVPAMRRLGELLSREGKPAEALAALEKARAVAPADSGVLYALGIAFRSLGRGADARAALESAIANDPDFPEAHNSLGGVWMEQRDPSRAEAAFNEALRQQPDLAEAHLNLGQLHAASANYAQAETHLFTATRLQPGLLQAWQVLGDVHSVRGSWAQAVKCYNQVLRVHPSDQAANLGLGTARAATGQIAAARDALNHAAAGANPALRQEALDLLRKLP